MKKIQLVLLTIFWSAWSGLVIAQGTLQKPVWEPTAVWSYRTIGLSTNSVVETTEQTVLSVTGERAALQHVSNKTAGASRWTYDVAHQKEVWSKRTGTYEAIRFPISVGDTWAYEYSYPSVSVSGATTTVKMTAKFVAWEDVTVPAGTYRAAKMNTRAGGPSALVNATVQTENSTTFFGIHPR